MVFKNSLRKGGKIASNRFYPLHSNLSTLFSSLLSPLSPLHLPLPSHRLDIKVVGCWLPRRVLASTGRVIQYPLYFGYYGTMKGVRGLV